MRFFSKENLPIRAAYLAIIGAVVFCIFWALREPAPVVMYTSPGAKESFEKGYKKGYKTGWDECIQNHLAPH